MAPASLSHLGRSLRGRLLLSTLAVVTVAIGGSAWLLVSNHEKVMHADAVEDAQALSETMAEVVSAAVFFEDAEGAQALLEKLARQHRVQSLALYDESEALLAHIGPDPAAQAQEANSPDGSINSPAGSANSPDGSITVERPIEHEGQRIGRLHLSLSTDMVEHRLGRGLLQVITGCALLLLACGALIFRLQGRIIAPLSHLAATMDRVASEGSLSQRLQSRRDDEIGALYRRFNEMLAQLEQQSQARERSQARLQALIDALPDLVFVLDGTGTYVDVLVSHHELLVRPASELIGQRVQDVLAPTAAAACVRAIDAALAGVTGERLEYSVQVPAGERDFEAVFARLPGLSETGQQLLLVVARDVTDRKALERQVVQARKMEAIGQLAGGVAHDFNNLLSGLMGYLELLRIDYPEEERLDEMFGISRNAAELIQQLLTFSRRAPLQAKPIDAAVLIDGVRRILERTVDRRITVDSRVPEEPLVMQGDASQLQSALLNLGVNARDAMPDGGQLLLEARALDLEAAQVVRDRRLPAGAYVELRVSDTGIGIPEDRMSRIFEPFFTTKRQDKGTGLGLAAVYGTAQSHHGAVEVDSEPGSGTTFRVYIPRVTRAGSSEDAETRASGQRPARANEHIVIVDDEDQVRLVTSAMLRRLGYRVTEFRDPRDAVAFYGAHVGEVGLLIVDMIMPHMGGAEVVRAVREVSDSAPILLVSGFSDMEPGSHPALAKLPLLGKPFTMAELSDQVEKALAQSRARRSAAG